MKKIALSLSLVFGLAGLSVHANASEGNAQAGKAKAASCGACHGGDGNSTITIYPKIAGQHEQYIYQQLKAFELGAQTNGEEGRYDPVMSSMAQPLTDQDMKDLAAHYASLEMTPGTTPEEVVAQGQALYVTGDSKRGIPGCIACHGPRGNGLAPAGFPKIAFQHVDYTKASLEKFRKGSRSNDKNGMMRDIAQKLTDKDIEVLSKYLGGLH